MTSFTYAAISAQGDGRVAIAFGHHLIRITAAETAGRLGVLEATVPAGEGPPLHVHEREDELFRVLSGRFGFWAADEFVELEEGGVIALPRGIPHRFQNVGTSEGKLLVVLTPGGFEGFFPLIEARQPQGFGEIAAIAAEFGLTFLPQSGVEAAA